MKFAQVLLASLLLVPAARADVVPPAPTCPVVLPACSNNGVDISQDPAAIVAAITEQQFCFQSVKLAEVCGTQEGATDIRFINAATAKCEARLKELNPSVTDQNNLSNLKVACNRKWFGKEGSQYISINGYCKLRALAWTLNLLDENE